MDKAPNRAKNATAIIPPPSHIQGTRSALRMTFAISAGRKLEVSPTTFIARETHNSPPVPATTIKVNRMKWDNLYLPRRSRIGPADHKNAQANNRDTRPSQGRNSFTQHQISQQRNHAISKRGSGLNEAVICPRQHQHISDEECDQRANSQPN